MLLIIILILVFAAGLLLPWWVLAIICFCGALALARSGVQAFWSGFAAVFVAWSILALIKSLPNHNILADRVAHLFSLPNWLLLLIVTGLLGGIVGGFATLSGWLFRSMFIRTELPPETPR